jgi:hypothetical protein
MLIVVNKVPPGMDTAQLPKPFQLNAIASRDWSLSSEWQRWSLSP